MENVYYNLFFFTFIFWQKISRLELYNSTRHLPAMSTTLLWRELYLRFFIQALVLISFKKTGNLSVYFKHFISEFPKTKSMTNKKSGNSSINMKGSMMKIKY